MNAGSRPGELGVIMRTARRLTWMLAIICFVCASAMTLLAQGTYRSQVRGIVADSSGAVVRDAKVTITEKGTNIASSMKTNDKGEYFFTGLRPSTYSMKVEAQGFRPEEQTNIVLAVDQQTTLNFTLSPGAITTAIQVNTTAPLLDT